MVEASISFRDPFIKGLASAALNPHLRNTLVLDCDPITLRQTVQVLAAMLEVTTGRPVEVITLDPAKTDDDLWGSVAFDTRESGKNIITQYGLLRRGNDDGFKLVFIPELTRLSLAASRAAIMTMDTPVVHLERHGQSEMWAPQICWLAGIDSRNTGRVALHLLDRWLLRLSGFSSEPDDRVPHIEAWLGETEPDRGIEPLVLSAADRRTLKEAQDRRPSMSNAALKRVFDYTDDLSFQGARRELALARLAQTVSRFDRFGQDQVTPTHVDDAAEVIGLQRLPQIRNPIRDREDYQHEEFKAEPFESRDRDAVATPSTLDTGPTLSTPSDDLTSGTPVYKSEAKRTFASTALPSHPYPEDHQPIERESASLRLPLARYRASLPARGPVVGVQRSTALVDIAIVSTLLEAAKFQTIRKRNQPSKALLQTILIDRSDLRSYRRSPIPEQMLMLVLDYTSMRDCEWQSLLIPYLSRAYIDRASMCLIQVGAKNAYNELQAERILAPNILAPKITRAFTEHPGKATPLAHGLDLALRTLRHTLQHGRSAVHHVRFLVISDGRGNVPLKASHDGLIAQPVGREGIEDALQIARAIRDVDDVESWLFNPQPQQHAELPISLAEALGSSIVPIPKREVRELVIDAQPSLVVEG